MNYHTYNKNLTRYYLDNYYYIDSWKIENGKFKYELWYKIPNHNAVFIQCISKNEFIKFMEEK